MIATACPTSPTPSRTTSNAPRASHKTLRSPNWALRSSGFGVACVVALTLGGCSTTGDEAPTPVSLDRTADRSETTSASSSRSPLDTTSSRTASEPTRNAPTHSNGGGAQAPGDAVGNAPAKIGHPCPGQEGVTRPGVSGQNMTCALVGGMPVWTVAQDSSMFVPDSTETPSTPGTDSEQPSTPEESTTPDESDDPTTPSAPMDITDRSEPTEAQ